MDTHLKIRKGTIEDISLFLTFFRKSILILFPQYSPNSVSYTIDVDYSPRMLNDKLTKGEFIVYLAFDKGTIVGYLLIAQSIAGVSYAEWLGVDKENQKRGIASSLLSVWEKDVFAEGVHSLHLWTTKNNVEFYEKRGFTCGGMFPKAWHGEDDYLIYKTLREPEEKNFLKGYLQEIKKG